MNNDLNKHLPLTESTYYILLTLTSELHGYGIMQKVDEISKGTVKLGPGTLYGVLRNLEKSGFIEEVMDDKRKKNYIITDNGKSLLNMQHERLEILYQNSLKVVKELR